LRRERANAAAATMEQPVETEEDLVSR